MPRKKVKKLTDLEALQIKCSELSAEVIKEQMARARLELRLHESEHEKIKQMMQGKFNTLNSKKDAHASKRIAILDSIRERLKFTGNFSYDPESLEIFVNKNSEEKS